MYYEKNGMVAMVWPGAGYDILAQGEKRTIVESSKNAFDATGWKQIKTKEAMKILGYNPVQGLF